MNLIVDPDGNVRCLYDEAIDLKTIGTTSVERASYVEPDEQGSWTADLHPVDGPVLGPFEQRSQALSAEQVWLDAFWLNRRR